MNAHTDRIASPCIRNCCLDEQDVCLGCFRSLTEITQWTQVNDATRQQFLDNAGQRQTDYRQQEIRRKLKA
jgi:predicted Fe-S protein YdhL (DUF1289 family)